MGDDGGSGPVFRFGDRVQYWRSGPVMHVITACTDHCYCHWVDAFGDLQHGTFATHNLAHAAASESGPPLE